MFVQGEIVEENSDGTVTFRTNDGLELRLPIDKFVDHIDSDLCELNYVTANTVKLSLLSRQEEGRTVTLAGPNSIVVLRPHACDGIFSDFISDSKTSSTLFEEKHLIIASGLLGQLEESLDPLSRAVRLLAGPGGLYISTPSGGEKFNQHTFTLGALSGAPGAGLIQNLVDILGESDLTSAEISSVVQAIEGLGSERYETMGTMLRVDEVEDLRIFFYYSSHLENGRLVHTPRSSDLRSRAVKAFCEYMFAGLVDWLDSRRKINSNHRMHVLELPLTSDHFSSYSELARVYLYDSLFGGGVAGMLERPVTGLFDLLEGAATYMNDAETFLKKLIACNPGIVRRGEFGFLLPNGLELRADDLLLALEVARVTSAWSSTNSLVDWILKRPLEKYNCLSLAKNKRDRFAISGWRSADSLLLRLKGQAQHLKGLMMKAHGVKKIHVLDTPELDGIEDVVACVLEGKQHPYSLSLSEAEYWVRYASLGVRMEPGLEKNGKLMFTLDQERAMNLTLVNVRTAGMMVVKSVWKRLGCQEALVRKSQAVRRIQRWFRRLRGEVNHSYGLKRNQKLWRELLETKRNRKLELQQLEDENNKLRERLREKECIISELSKCSARTVEEAEQGIADPLEVAEKTIRKLEIRIAYLEKKIGELSPARGC